ncbi:uncharacterized protein LOC141674204 [Apium graveolens]|uniref:uncharacterized protein LOC141674204 n=1 Tax=Apium graveolens TaxID=4045 RepID=UPI003D7BE480
MGGSQYPNWLIEGFNDAIQDIGLVDMNIVGHQFTWERGRDHSPIFLVPQQKTQINTAFRFRFENAWLIEPICEQIIKDGWYVNSDGSIQQKVKACNETLAVWGKEVTGNFSKRIKKCK